MSSLFQLPFSLRHALYIGCAPRSLVTTGDWCPFNWPNGVGQKRCPLVGALSYITEDEETQGYSTWTDCRQGRISKETAKRWKSTRQADDATSSPVVDSSHRNGRTRRASITLRPCTHLLRSKQTNCSTVVAKKRELALLVVVGVWKEG